MLALESGLLAYEGIHSCNTGLQTLAASSEWVQSFTMAALAILAAVQQKLLPKIFQLKTPLECI